MKASINAANSKTPAAASREDILLLDETNALAVRTLLRPGRARSDSRGPHRILGSVLAGVTEMCRILSTRIASIISNLKSQIFDRGIIVLLLFRDLRAPRARPNAQPIGSVFRRF